METTTSVSTKDDNIIDNVAKSISSATNSAVKIANDATKSVIDSTNSVIDSTKNSKVASFLDSNSFISKISFLLLVIFSFYIILHLTIYWLSLLITKTTSPKIIYGMINAKNNTIIFPQNPSLSGSIPIYKSDNQNDGIEFTWTIWLFISEIGTTYQHIFNKGNQNISGNGLNEPNNAPGLYILPNQNKLLVLMNTYDVINENIIIPDIPLNKWVSVIIICKNNELNIYINGIITKSHLLQGVPKQNYGDINVALNGGFNGYISNLFYYNYALGINDIQSLVSKGPNTTISSSGTSTLPTSDKTSDYLSLRWYLNS
uniref:LamG-like jellyroll fold domain-containing protein n=1 Tax=viral metagenome TaxID=1070528 RepID=A0A6C0H6H4_9ZZZZ